MKMKPKMHLAIAASLVAAGGLMTSFSASAQSEPPSYTASPDVYKLLSENDQFRVILQNLKPGKRDAWHSHAGAVMAYPLASCKVRFHTPDGKSVDRESKKGVPVFVPATPSHSVENIGKTACQVLVVERK
jgi:beta-alanine degradation protein BauB